MPSIQNKQQTPYTIDPERRIPHRIEIGQGRVVDLFVLFSLLLVILLVILLWRAAARDEALSGMGILISLLTLLNLLVYRWRPKIAVYVLSGLVTFGVAWTYVSGGISQAGRFWMLPYPIIIFFLLGHRQGKFWSLVMVGWIILVNIASAFGLVNLPYEPGLNTSFLVLFAFFVSLSWIRSLQYTAQLKRTYTEMEHERKLENEFHKFKMAVDAVSDQVVITEPDGTIIYANPATEHLTGWKPNEILGQKAGTKKLWGGLMPAEFYQTMWRVIKHDRKPFSGEVTNHRKDGQQYVAKILINPILDKNNDVVFFVGVEEDITREKEVEEAKTEFLSIASHQLQTPIATIGWLTEALTDNVAGKLSKRQLDLVEKIDRSNQRMVELVNALLNTSRLEVGTVMITPEKMDLEPLLHEIANEVMTKPMHKVTLTEEYAQDAPTLAVDSTMLRTVIQNLLTNAVRYTPDGGQIWLRLKYNNQSIIIEVSDTGIGIPVGSRDHIFSKFYRAPNATRMMPEGIGLGMYITKSILDVTGGSITFNSAEGRGTTFQITYPRSGMKAKSGTRHLALLTPNQS